MGASCGFRGPREAAGSKGSVARHRGEEFRHRRSTAEASADHNPECRLAAAWLSRLSRAVSSTMKSLVTSFTLPAILPLRHEVAALLNHNGTCIKSQGYVCCLNGLLSKLSESSKGGSLALFTVQTVYTRTRQL